MSEVVAGASMSLDGFVAGPGESGFDLLFGWMGGGSEEVPTAQPDRVLRMSPASAKVLRAQLESTGALLVGRRLFDMTSGWGGTHPFGGPVVVVTHRAPAGWEDSPFTFVTEGIEAAVARAKELADGRDVGVNAGEMARQCLEAGLLDAVRIDLVPVLLGGGVPLFGEFGLDPVRLGTPDVTVGEGVTHLRYPVAGTNSRSFSSVSALPGV
ncbi:dihydrofolate reductase family protein [Amycolatopsis sp. GA6-003]|uniref:dihydrofolate reductase family protein n=1 Tax=Amycolatopsis sp. GA6-003 TaxID=2652444 RepID=UPI003917599B